MNTQTNTCPVCRKITTWEVIEGIYIKDHQYPCPEHTTTYTTEPTDASGYSDVDTIDYRDTESEA